MKERTHRGVNLCGWCAGAPLCSEGPTFAHRRCHSPEDNPCACAARAHRLDPKIADVMAAYCHLEDIDAVYRVHNRKRRVISDERRQQLTEQLARARQMKGNTQAAVIVDQGTFT